MKQWCDENSYLEDVALVFAVITVANSIMMAAGWDTPKSGTFAYTHLLSRLAIAAVVVSLFHLGDLRLRLERWRDGDRRQRGASRRRRAAVELIAGQLPRSPLTRVAVAFTVATALLCVVAIAGSVWRAPRGGVALYQALLVLAATTAALVGLGSGLVRSRRGRLDDSSTSS